MTALNYPPPVPTPGAADPATEGMRLCACGREIDPDDGPLCDECKAAADAMCLNCDGHGVVVPSCEACGGTGDTCAACAGHGQRMDLAGQCEDCGGTGKKEGKDE